MLDIKQIVFDLLSAILAAIIGLILFRKLDLFYRLLLLHVIIYLLLECIGQIVENYYAYNGWVYNIEIFAETALLFSAAQAYFKSNKSKFVLLTLFVCFLIILLADIFYINSIRSFAYHAAIAEGLFMTGTYITILYFQFMKKTDRFVTLPVILASTGMILYFAGTIPDLGLVSFLQKIDPHLDQELFQNIVVVLSDVRYLFIAIAFFLAGRTSDTARSNKVLFS